MNQLRPQLANLEARCSKEILLLEGKLAQAEDRALSAEREKASVSVEFEQEHWDLAQQENGEALQVSAHGELQHSTGVSTRSVRPDRVTAGSNQSQWRAA